MDKLEKYKNSVLNIINRYGSYKHSYGDVEIQIICDEKNNHYQILNLGWHGNKRIYGCSLHIDIKNNKVWIQHNGTENSIAKELIELGVAKDDIVLGFHTPYMRRFTDYSIN